MKAKLILLTALAVLVLAGCEAPRNGPEAIPAGPAEQTIQAPLQKVRSAATKTMSERGYQLTPVGADTLLFDRVGDLGSTIKFDFLNGKESWRRVRMRLTRADTATRVTIEPALVVNRGSAFEREEMDHSGKARQIMQDILERIRAEALAGGRGQEF